MNPTSGSGLVLAGFAESLAAVESVWMLLDAGFEVVAFRRAGSRCALQRDRRVVVHEIGSPRLDAELAIADLVELAGRLRPIAVLPLDDDAVWLTDRARLADGFPAVAGPTGLLAQLALDKRLQLQHAAGHLAVLPTVVADPAAPAGDLVPDAPGPWIVKPAHAVRVRDGRLGKGRACIAETAAAVRAAVEAAAEPMLVQPVAAGVGEGVFGFCHNGEVLAWSGHRRIRMMNPAGSGSSACRSVDVEAELASAAQGFLRSAQWTGLFMLEFLRADVGTDSVAWFMELNGRTWGSMPLARHRGLPYPVWAVQAAAGLPIRPAAVQPEGHLTARHLGRELVHLAFLLRGRRSHPEWPTVRASLLGMTRWRRGDRFYNFDHRRPAVFLSDTLVTLASQLRPRGRSRS